MFAAFSCYILKQIEDGAPMFSKKIKHFWPEHYLLLVLIVIIIIIIIIIIVIIIIIIITVQVELW